MPPKQPSQLMGATPQTLGLLERVDYLVRAYAHLVASLTGKTITDFDVAGSIAFQAAATLTIASGVISVETGAGQNLAHYSMIVVDTEGAAATDDLDTINGGRDGMILFLRAANDARTVVVKNGTGNIVSAGDITLDTYNQIAILVYVSDLAKWIGIASGGGGAPPSHAPVTLGGGSDPALALSGQQLTLADVLTPTEHTAIGDGAPHHAAVTLGTDADVLLGLSAQQFTLDSQNPNLVFAGPDAAPAADPTFRVLVSGDIPTLDHGAKLTGLGDDDHTQYALRSILTTLGDIIYAGAAAVWTRLAGNITTTRKFLRQVGTGAASAAPAWDTLEDADIPATIARDTEVTTAVSDHAALATGVHGVGASTVESASGSQAKVDTHAGLADPHTGYRLESADHSHQSTGAQAGLLDHGLALTGLTDDDHTQYLKEEASGGLASEVPDHTHANIGEAGGTLYPNTLVLPGATSPTQTVEGQVLWDTDDDHLTIGDGTSRKRLVNQGDLGAEFTLTGDAITLATDGHGASKHTNRTHTIPYHIEATQAYSVHPYLPDETAGARLRIEIAVPLNWDGVSDITVKTIWEADATGNMDLETQIGYRTEVDENSFVTVQAWTNTNLSWAAAGTNKVLTTTITAANIAASRYFDVSFRRGTGDANAGGVSLVGVRVDTGLDY